MRIRTGTFILLTLALLMVTGYSVLQRLQPETPAPHTRATLQNIRTFVAAAEAGGTNFAVDGGLLYSGTHGEWTQIPTPPAVIVNAVAVQGADDAHGSVTLVIGAANGMEIFRSVNQGKQWEKFTLPHEFIGGISDLAWDATQDALLVATDTAGIFRVRFEDDRREGVPPVVDAHWFHDKPVVQLAAAGDMVLARTDWALWQLQVDVPQAKIPPDQASLHDFEWRRTLGLDDTPTSVTVVPGEPTMAYVGTSTRGVLRSVDGDTWQPFNAGLAMGTGAQLRVDALAADHAQPGVLYVATSHVLGSRERHHQPAQVAYISQEALPWAAVSAGDGPEEKVGTVATLLPVSGRTGAVYALTMQSRSPVALGRAAPSAASVTAASDTAASVTAASVAAASTSNETAGNPLHNTLVWSWVIAGLAGIALVYALFSDLRRISASLVRSIQPQRTE